ncbi:D-methionine transport system ATP-binding protein [Scopulibacillus darangshiensis]|uniref:D-methionine transport system ATP-binding protein n=1 Tax=Scopulibacillus darangshiensis TaxID=442528 RepID=A0A4R2NQ56_9BACL|nr:methionine ABC transporter ATP-binding protein [Scopulibacillus darangshiensis]TCP23508.1 D-methionine transport system ATP-binding protein [Scopulibacillus darangshiensis]
MIKLKGIKKFYKTKTGLVNALNGIDLEVNKGDIFGVIGYSGAGKSTLIRLINMLEKPSEGRINVDGSEMSTLSKKALRDARKQIGMIFQHFNLLWSRNVKDNIAFPLEIAGVPKRERERKVKELIHLVGLEGRESAYPSQLSGGQKQRVGIARALANDPKVLLCDEATSALDPKTTEAILDLLVDINQKLGLTIILITHEMHVIKKICHQVAVIDNGIIVEEGEVLDVFRSPQMAITKDFVKQVTSDSESEEAVKLIKQTYPSATIARLTFAGEAANRPVISELLKQEAIDVNLLEGNLSQTQRGALGTLTLLLDGEAPKVKDAITFVENQGVVVEVIQHASEPVS